jgi:hypothetical protein
VIACASPPRRLGLAPYQGPHHEGQQVPPSPLLGIEFCRCSPYTTGRARHRGLSVTPVGRRSIVILYGQYPQPQSFPRALALSIASRLDISGLDN